jgi:hypothetical protein
MKAVVVEIRSNKAAVLSDNGCVVTVKNNGYEIGQVIQMIDSKKKFTKKIAVFAASAAAFVLVGTGTWAYASPYSYVSMDVNPSIEYTVNRFDRVLSIKAINDDGEEILQAINLDDLENKTIEDAILKTVDQITTAGYFNTTTDGGIVITTASENTDKADELATDLQQAVEEEIAEVSEDIIVEAYSVGLERVEEARELGVTPGKLNLVEKLQSSSSDPASVDIEEWLNRSVKDIMKATKDNRKASSVTGPAISVEEKDNTLAEKEEKREAQKQHKEEQKLQKEELKQQDEELKQQNDEIKQQKDDRKEEEQSRKKSKDNQKKAKVEDSSSDKDEQKSIENKKDKDAKQSDDASTSAKEKGSSNSPAGKETSSPSENEKDKDKDSSVSHKNDSDTTNQKASDTDQSDTNMSDISNANEDASNPNSDDDNLVDGGTDTPSNSDNSSNSGNSDNSGNSGNSGNPGGRK